MKPLFPALITVLVLSWSGCTPEIPKERSRGKFEPASGKVLLIIGQDAGVFETYTKAIGITPAGFMAYTSIQEVNGLDRESRYEGVTQYAQPTADGFTNTVVQIGLYMVDALDRVNNGEFDLNIDRLGDWIQKSRRPVFLRIGYEFDGAHNHYDPEKYKASFRHIVNRLRKQGVDNVAYVWHSTSTHTEIPIEAWYPGDDFVDWFGITYFDQPQSIMLPMVELAKAHGKPLMIAESTPRAGSSTYFGKGSWDSWFTKYFQFIQTHDIKAISYIDDNWESMHMWKGKGWGDARVEANPYIKRHWIKEISKPRYLQSSTNLFSELGYRR
jgi:hypothetical protein